MRNGGLRQHIQIKIIVHIKINMKEEIAVERILGINEVRPRLTRILDELEAGGEAVIITAKSQPRGVLLSFVEYRELKSLAGKIKEQWLEETLGRFRERGEGPA